MNLSPSVSDKLRIARLILAFKRVGILDDTYSALGYVRKYYTKKAEARLRKYLRDNRPPSQNLESESQQSASEPPQS